MKTKGLYSTLNSKNTNKYKTLQKLTTNDFIQIFDSVYTWKWDATSLEWAKDIKFTDVVYDANHNLAGYTMKNWNGTAWVKSSKYTAVYDANNYLLSFLAQAWDGLSWGTGHFKNLFAYDTDYNLISEVNLQWTGSDWGKNYQYLYSYDANKNLTLKLDQSWNGSDWENDYQYVYTFDAGNNQTSESDQSWYGSNWLTYSQYNNSFDANGISLSDTYKEWDEFGNKVISGDSSYYYYHTVVTEIPGLNVANASVYPNPARGRITVSSNSRISAIEIYTLSGKLVFADRKMNQPSKEIDLSGYAKGMYFVKIYNGKKFYNKKVVIQ